MRYLLDTHTLIWLFENNPQLSDRAKLIIVDENNELFISIASLWEMTIKSSLGKLDLSLPLSELFAQKLIPSDIQILPIQLQQLAILQELPFHHRDPFDRIIIAQAIAENLTLLSTDRMFENYQVTSQAERHQLELAIHTHIQRIEADDQGLAIKLYPFTRSYEENNPRIVVVDPRIAFGRLTIDGTGIATSILKERYSAGDSLALASHQRIDDLAIDYDCDRLSIEEAIRCELSPFTKCQLG